TAVALACRRVGNPVPDAPPRAKGTTRGRAHRSLWTDPRILFTVPVILAPSFIITGFFFHQGRLLQEKGWAFEGWASWFVGYAVARAVFMAASGPVIDRFGAARILPFFLAPLAVSMAAVVWFGPSLGIPFCLVPMGISSGISATLVTALWVELYGPDRLAEVRATVSAANVVASGTAPSLMGWLIDLHVALSVQAAACLLFIAFASCAATRVRAYARAGAAP
ncbi:MAG: hypothetical protein AB7O80_20520, partial [Acetobacteraceae bacterium]